MASRPYSHNPSKPERRAKLRMECSFQATVYGYAEDGQRFAESATLMNVSAAGLYMRMNRVVETGEILHIRFSFSNETGDIQAPCVSVVGTVLRSELLPDGACGLAVKFNRRRLL